MQATAATNRDMADLDDGAIRASLRSAIPPKLVWAAPDMSVLKGGRREPPTMPTELFGPIWPLLGEIAEGAGAPVDYVALGFLSVCASLVGGRRKVRPYEAAKWAEPCILWAGLVGDPSSNKSPGLDAVTDPMREMERAHAEAHNERLRGWQGDVERAKLERASWMADVKQAAEESQSTPPMPIDAEEPAAPQRRRLLVQDSTPEGLAVILAGNPSGTLHLRDELAGWLTSFDRYTPGGREFWLEAYGGRPFVIDRKGSAQPIMIPFNGVSVVGGIQPDKLADSLLGRGKPDDGLVARFLWAWPERPPYRRPHRPADMAALQTLYSRLDGLGWAMGQDGRDVAAILPLDPSAADVFSDFEQENREAGDEAGGLFKSFCGKLPGLLLRLALVSELSRWAYSGGDEPHSISVGTIEAAAEFIDAYAKPSAMRVFGDAALPTVERNAATLARHLIAHKKREFNARTYRRKAGLPGMKEADPFNEAVAFLAEPGVDWLRSIGSREGDTPGRKSSDYEVNPAVFGGANV